jgi:glutamate synthase (ferredoxin)
MEPWTEIQKFKTGAMSLARLVKPPKFGYCHEQNGKSNSGEEEKISSRFIKNLNGDSKNSAIKTVLPRRDSGVLQAD